MSLIQVSQAQAEDVARAGGEAHRSPEGDFVRVGTPGYEYRTGDYEGELRREPPEGSRRIVPGVDCPAE
jgi:hypothetical protein